MKALRIAALGAVVLVAAAQVAIAQPPVAQQPRQDRTDTRDGKRDGGRGIRDGRRGGPRGEGVGRALLRGVHLTEAQQTQIRTINQKYAEQRRTLMQEVRGAGDRTTRPDSAARAQLRTRVQSLAERQRTEVRAILTPDQQKTFDANVARIRDRVEGQRGDRGDRQRGVGPRGRALRGEARKQR